MKTNNTSQLPARRHPAELLPTVLARWVLLGVLVLSGAIDRAVAQIRTPVTINCPANITAECTGDGGTSVRFNVTATSTAGRITSVTSVPESGSLFPVGTTTVRCTATDALRNTATCSFTVTVRDSQAPVLTVPSPIEIACAPPAGRVVEFKVTAVDGCDASVIPVCTPPSGSVFPVGATTVVCQARDGSGNLAQKSFTVTVSADSTPPQLALPGSLRAPCASPRGAIVEFAASALDACDGPVPVTSTPPSGSLFPIGTTSVLCVAVDSRGNTVRGSFEVVVTDECLRDCLSLRCPEPITVACAPKEGAKVEFAPEAASSCGDPVTVTTSPASGSLFPPGTTPVTCIARDTRGNERTCTFTVTVISDATPPQLVLPSPNFVPCTGPDGASVRFEASATDDCDRLVTVVCQPPSGSNFPIGSTTVACTATDRAGNTATGSFVVAVTGDCARDCLSLRCPADITAECAGPAGTPVVFSVDAASSCGDAVTVTTTPSSGALFPPGTTLVNSVATDARGNSRTCTFRVTVRDTARPVLTLPNVVEAECTSPAGAIVTFTALASDACDPGHTLLLQPPSGTLFPIGTTTVTCTATDASGNIATGSFPVVVKGTCGADCLALACPAPIEITLEAEPQSGAVVTFAPSATDTCTGQPVPVTSEPPSGSLFPVGVTTVQTTATLGTSTRQCSFTVTVLDKTPPVLAVPRTRVVPCTGFGLQAQAGAAVPFTVTATDNADPRPLVTCVPPSGSFFAVGTHTVTCTAQDASGNKSTRSFQVTVQPGPKCLVSVPPELGLAPDNWGFENGLTAWAKVEGDAFDFQPNQGDVMPAEREPALRQQMESAVGGDYWRHVDYNVGHRGSFWLSTGHNVNNQPGQLFDGPLEELTGTLRSKSFEITTPYLSFLIGGDADMEKLRVELLFAIANPGPGAIQFGGTWYTPVYPATGTGRELMRRVILPVKDYIGTKALVRIIDHSLTGHLNVDDFRFHPVHPTEEKIFLGLHSFPAVVNSGGLYYDWDSPVWGFTDTHTHPMSHLGFGYKVMHGRPDGPVYEALANCNCTHGGWGLDNTCGDYLRELVIKMSDDKGDDPHGDGYNPNPWMAFRKWPSFTTITHQQMYHSWIRRAYDGGLRVMVALCVNNPLLATAVKGEGPRDDKTVGDLQIKELKAFVARHDDFMEIALDPIQLRDIVRRNKLAIVIGSELDDIGNLGQNPLIHANSTDPAARNLVTAEIQRLYDLGLRYIFPVHLMDNKFGGTGVGSDMLNIANKFVNDVAFDLEAAPASDNINARLANLDFTAEVGLGLAAVSLGPVMFPVFESAAAAISTKIGPIPPGSASLAATFLPIGMIGLAPLIVTELVADGIPINIFPLFGNYPSYPEAPHGHRNKRSLTLIGEHAIREMMRRGMMIDMDHMSQATAAEVIALAKSIPGGYPLNSGHNSFRETNVEKGENNRSPEQMEALRELGGVMGVGYENSETRSVSGPIPSPKHFSSQVKNNAAGTARSFAQSYLYALEKTARHGVAFGTDINGLIPGPGPRFGGQGAFALPDDKDTKRDDQIKAQSNGVLYEPRHGRPITSAAFAGKAIDPDREFEPARTWLGYAYNTDQRDFFAALRIFYWMKGSIPSTEGALLEKLHEIQNGFVGNYNNRRIIEYAFGLLKGMKGWAPGSDLLDGDVETRQRLGIALARYKYFDEPEPSSILGNWNMHTRFKHHLVVWSDYDKTFGDNLPMKRCQTFTREWDINFEGVAHYGLLPDFIQDLRNVGVNPDDLTPLFQSAEHFAQMWTRCLKGSYAFVPHFDLQHIVGGTEPDSGRPWLNFSFAHGSEEYEVEESDSAGPGAEWRPASGELNRAGVGGSLSIPVQTTQKFYRLRKK